MTAAKELALAASRGDLEAMRATIAAEPELAKDWQPLMDACFAGQVAAARLLLDHGADPNVVSKSTFRYRPLHRTMERKATFPRGDAHLAVVKLLLEHGADPMARGTMQQLTAVAVAALAGDARFLPSLLEHVPEPDVYTVAVLGDVERLTALLDGDPSLAASADINGWTALRYCCHSRLGEADGSAAQRQMAVARLLLERGATADGCLDPVVYRNNAGLAELLLEHGAELLDGDTLNHAACDGAYEALDVLLRRGVNLNMTHGTEHHGGYTPFGCTLTMRSVRGAQWFLERGIDPNYVGGKAGESSLHVAVRSGAGPALLKLLVDRGADPNARDDANLTPLAAARSAGQKSAIEFFTSIGAEG